MNNNNWNNWLLLEKEKVQNGRTYLHFDEKHILSKKTQAQLFKKFSNQLEEIGQHQFFPFLYKTIETKKYKFNPALDKGEFKPKIRPICYSSHFDSFIYSWYCYILAIPYENQLLKRGLSSVVTAYRKINGKSNIEYSSEVFEIISQRKSCTVLAFDITGFFDNLDHTELKECWQNLLNETQLPLDHFKVYKSLTEFSYINVNQVQEFTKKRNTDKDKKNRRNRICSLEELHLIKRDKGNLTRNKNKKGIPQGSPISAFLSNLYLLEFDTFVHHLSNKLNATYRRYSDDIIIICNNADAKSIENQVLKKIKAFKLEINQSKTDVTYFRLNQQNILRGYHEKGNYKHLQYLGFEFNGQHAYIRSSSLSNYYKNARKHAKSMIRSANHLFATADNHFRKNYYNKFSTRSFKIKNSQVTNFITYAKRADKIVYNSKISSQINNHFSKIKTILKEEIDRKDKKIIRKFKKE